MPLRGDTYVINESTIQLARTPVSSVEAEPSVGGAEGGDGAARVTQGGSVGPSMGAGAFALGVLSRLLTVLRLMYSVRPTASASAGSCVPVDNQGVCCRCDQGIVWRVPMRLCFGARTIERNIQYNYTYAYAHACACTYAYNYYHNVDKD